MDDAFRVRGIERVGNLSTQLDHLLDFQRLTGYPVLQRLALHELHGDEMKPAVFGNLVNRGDVGMVQCGGGSGFASQTFERLRVFRQVFGEEFQRDVSAEAEVFGFIHHSHSAAANLL